MKKDESTLLDVSRDDIVPYFMWDYQYTVGQIKQMLANGVDGRRAFRNYDRVDGLQSNEFNRQQAFKTASGELFFCPILLTRPVAPTRPRVAMARLR